MHSIRTFLVLPVLLGIFLLPQNVVCSPHCEALKTTLNYSQGNAPRDISSILRVVVEKVNRELEGE